MGAPVSPAAAPRVAFRLDPPSLARACELFNARSEIHWFGFEGGFEEDAAVIRFCQQAFATAQAIVKPA